MTAAPAPYLPGVPMRACWWEGPERPLRTTELPAPSVLEATDVILRMRIAMFGAALVRAATVGHPKLVPPTVLGSLVVGDVVAVGAAVGHVRLGDRVVVNPHPACGRCADCRSGRGRLCTRGARVEPGALAGFVRVTGDTKQAVRPVPESVSDRAAIFAEPLACAVAAVEDGGVTAKDDVLIIGSGPMAFLLAAAATHAGAASVTCTVRNRSRQAVLESAGFSTRPVGPDGAALRDGRRTFSVVFEAVGQPETYTAALDAVSPGGTLVAFGGCAPGSRFDLDVNRLHYSCIRLVGSYHYPPGAFDLALRLVADRSVDPAPLASRVIPLGEIERAPVTAREADVLTLLVKP